MGLLCLHNVSIGTVLVGCGQRKHRAREMVHYMYRAMQELVVIKVFYNYRPCSILAQEVHAKIHSKKWKYAQKDAKRICAIFRKLCDYIHCIGHLAPVHVHTHCGELVPVLIY